MFAITDRALDADDDSVVPYLIRQAAMYRDREDYVQAAVIHRRALARLEPSTTSRPLAVASVLESLALDYAGLDRPGEALKLLLRALTLNENGAGGTSVEAGRTLAYLGSVRTDLEQYTEARASYDAALAILKQAEGATESDVRLVEQGLAALDSIEKARAGAPDRGGAESASGEG